MFRRHLIARAGLALAAVATTLVIAAPVAAAAEATTTTVTADPATSVWGQPVTLTATVTSTTTPAGNVEFRDGVTTLGVAPAVAGVASISTSALVTGQHELSAVFTPTDPGAFSGSTGSVQVTVNKADTTTSAAVAPDPTVAGQDATFSATVAATPPGAGTPTGIVEFADQGGPIFASGPLNSLGSASATDWAFAGLYTVVATYGGDENFNGSSSTITQHVDRAATTTTLTITPNPVAPGGEITVLAIVDVTPPGDVQLAGSLQFSIDGEPFGAPISLGGGAIGYQVVLTVPTSPQTDVIGVAYSGDFNTQPSFDSVALTIAEPRSPAPAALPAPAAQASTVASAGPAVMSVSRLSAMTAPLAAALRTRGLAALTSTVQRLTAPGPGVVEQKVYTPDAPAPARAAATKKKRVLLASGSHRFAAAGKGTLRLRVSSAGRKAIRRAKSTKLAIVTRFKPATGSAVVATRRLTVKTKPKRGARATATIRGFTVVSMRRW